MDEEIFSHLLSSISFIEWTLLNQVHQVGGRTPVDYDTCYNELHYGMALISKGLLRTVIIRDIPALAWELTEEGKYFVVNANRYFAVAAKKEDLAALTEAKNIDPTVHVGLASGKSLEQIIRRRHRRHFLRTAYA